MDYRDIIRKNPGLIWYSRNYDGFDEATVVEAVLNGGDWGELLDLFSSLGRERVARIFFEQVSRPRCNYSEKRANFFKNFFSQYARGNFN